MTLRQLIAGFILGALAGCGGGGGSGSAPAPIVTAPPPPPVSGVDLVRGTITGFGSVFINGKRFATDNATFNVDGQAGSQSDLKVGMVVRVSGDSDDGTAAEVSYDEDVKGPVDSTPVVAANGVDMELVVMGQTVIVKTDTIVDNNLDLALVSVGDILEVSGFRGANDIIEAAFMEAKDPGDVDKYEVIGFVRNLNETAQTFVIGGLLVNYANAVIDDLPGGLANDILVEVKDELTAYAAGMMNPTLDATKVEGTSFLGNDDDDNIGEVEIEAIISEIVDAGTFRIAGIDVHHDANTVFLFGDATMLEAGVKIEVKGTLNDDDSVQARQIKFKRNASRMEAVVDMVVDDDTVIVFGVTVDVAADADIRDSRDDQDPFNVSDLMIGDFVEVRGLFTEGRMIASELERDDGDDDTEIRGVATNIDVENRTLTILGIDVFSDANTQYELDDDDDGSSSDTIISADAFFDTLVENQTIVEAKWDGNVPDASTAVKELEIEN